MKAVDWSVKFITILQIADELMFDGNEKLDLSDKEVWDLAPRVGSEIEYYLTSAALGGFDEDISARTLSKWIERGFTLGLEPDWSGPQMMSAYARHLVSDARQRLDDLPPPFNILGEVDEDETMDCRAIQKWIYGKGIWRRDEIISHCASRLIEALEACHYGRLLIGKPITQDEEWLEALDKKLASERADAIKDLARKAANARHAEDNETGERIQAWYSENYHLYRSMDKAAEAAIKLEPVAFKTARKHIGIAAKKLPSARKG